jgi:hypothetical protein
LSFLLPIPVPPVLPVDLEDPPSVEGLEPDMPDESDSDERDDPFIPPRDAELPIPSSFWLPRSVRLRNESLFDSSRVDELPLDALC